LPVSAIDVITPALRHTKQQLFSPFRLGQWVRLAIVGLLAGELTSGGCSFQFPVGGGGSSRDRNELLQQIPPLPDMAPALIVLVLVLVVFGIALAVLFTYINSMMRFVLFDSVVNRECRVRQFWRQRRAPGFKYFVFQLVFALLAVAVFIIVIGVPAGAAALLGWFTNPRDHLLGLILGGIALFLVAGGLTILLAVIAVLTKDFVVPQMALQEVTALEGWRRLWPMMQSEKLGYLGYIGMKIVLALAAAIVLGIAGLIVFLVLLLPIGGVGALVVLAGYGAGFSWNPLTIALAVVAGLIALAFIFFVLALLSVPATVFFPAYSYYFFAGRYPPLDQLLASGPDSP
jgi:hypothetical protein